jgi:hypothetical protein
MAYRAHGLSSVLPTRLLFTQRLDNIADTWYDDKKLYRQPITLHSEFLSTRVYVTEIGNRRPFNLSARRVGEQVFTTNAWHR